VGFFDPAVAAHRCAAARLELYAAALDGSSVRRGEGWAAVVTGVQSNDLNGIVTASSKVLPGAQLDDVWRWMADAAVPASLLTPEPDAGFTARLTGRGAEPERTGWWATGPLRVETSPSAVPVVVRSVANTADLGAWLDVAELCGWVDDGADRAARADLYLAVGLDHPRLRHWVAWSAAGEPVGMASSFLDGDVVDLCNLAVVESAQRQGIGTALTLRRLRHGVEAGAVQAVSALSPDGWALYRGLGFRSVPVVPDTWFYLPRGDGSSGSWVQ
jgi:ribosomal protein S18 acetylase RimI-like enzyme